MTNPVLATEDQLAELFSKTAEDVKQWERRGLTAVGTYTPPRGRPVHLYSVTAAARFNRSQP
ncbi:hypothetical protein [Mycolicibacterium houstonense]|uniref:hypothetical protein n=1 Tax=Mycolicibacterium houstonense TaxID=146021 RepID=UPI00082B5510|nr:hypothetical protein [Mycolicibacterium houstonense]